MSLSKVTLTWNLTDLISSGIGATISLVPTAVLTDTTNHVVVPEVARSRVFTGGTGTLPGIIACDNSTITPAGWAYTITVTLPGGAVLLSFNAFINFAAGATQDLSDLTPVSSVTTMQGYLPLPSGTPAAGQAPVATGTGETSAWKSVLQAANNLSDTASPAVAYQRLGGGHYTALQGWFAALAGRGTANTGIAIIGDSLTEGQGASAFTGRYAGALNTGLRGAGGLGFVPLHPSGENTFTWPVTLATGSWVNIALGPMRYAANMTGATSFTFTAPAGSTSARVLYYDAAVGGSFTYKVNAGGTTTVTNGGTGDGALTSSIPMNSGDVLTIAWASGSAIVSGIIHYAGDESSGITAHACGHFGWNASSNSFGWQQNIGFDWRPSLVPLATGAIGIMLGINDARVGAGNFTAAQFTANMTSLISFLRGNATLAPLPVFLIAAYQVNETFADSGGWPAYVAALYSVAAANPPADVVDLTLRMPAATASQTWGLYNVDGLHPSDRGHQMIADTLCQFLSPS